MDGLRGGISKQRVEENQSGIQVVARANFDRFLRGGAVAYQHYVILEGADLDRAPGNLFNNAGVSLNAHGDHVAHLKRPVCLQRDAGKEISQRVLKRKAKDDAEDR